MTRPASPRAARASLPRSADEYARIWCDDSEVEPAELNRELHGWTGTVPPEPWAFRSIERELGKRERERHA